MSGEIKNMGASIRQRLKNKGRELKLPFDQVLRRYAIERFLYRLSQTEYCDRFVLKGGQMLIVWQSEQLRPTRDIDFLGFTDNSLENLSAIMRDLCARNQQQLDGITFDPATVESVSIKDESEYKGVRITFDGTLDTANVHIQIDVGFNDDVTPQPDIVHYPSLLGMEEAKLRGYNRETQIAEKYETMVTLGELNSRMKDYFDIWLLSSRFNFDQRELGAALQATFKQRGTTLDATTSILRSDFIQSDNKQKQWSAFLKKSSIDYAPAQFSEVAAHIVLFIEPVLYSFSSKDSTTAVWNAPGPWSTTS